MRKLLMTFTLVVLAGCTGARNAPAGEQEAGGPAVSGSAKKKQTERIARVMDDIRPMLKEDRTREAVRRVNQAIQRSSSPAEVFQLRMTNIRVLLAATLQGKVEDTMLRRQGEALLEESSGRRGERAHLIVGKIRAALGSYDRAEKLLNTYLEKYPEPPAVKVRHYREKTGENHPRVMYRYLARRMLDKIQMVGQRVPDFEVTTLGGESRSPDSYRGQVWLLNFWSTDVEACRKEVPNLKALNHAHGNDFAVLGLNMDKRQKKVESFVDRNGINWDQVRLPEDSIVPNRFSVQSVPATFLMDEDGTVQAVGIRGKRLRKKVRKLLTD